MESLTIRIRRRIAAVISFRSVAFTIRMEITKAHTLYRELRLRSRRWSPSAFRSGGTAVFENHACETEDHGSGSDRDVEERLLLGEHSACKSGESVGDRKADDLYPAFVFCQRCNKSVIVTGCPEQISGSRI